MLSGTLSRECPSSIDQGDVGKGLRKVPHARLPAGVVFFRKQADVVPQHQKPFEEPFCFYFTASAFKILNHPEGTGDKGRFEMVSSRRHISIAETLPAKLFLDHLHRAYDTLIVEWQKSDDW